MAKDRNNFKDQGEYVNSIISDITFNPELRIEADTRKISRGSGADEWEFLAKYEISGEQPKTLKYDYTVFHDDKETSEEYISGQLSSLAKDVRKKDSKLVTEILGNTLVVRR